MGLKFMCMNFISDEIIAEPQNVLELKCCLGYVVSSKKPHGEPSE